MCHFTLFMGKILYYQDVLCIIPFSSQEPERVTGIRGKSHELLGVTLKRLACSLLAHPRRVMKIAPNEMI